jgi:hypothetical protein
MVFLPRTPAQCRVVEVAKIITILLANSNPRNISLLRDRFGRG